LRSYRRISRAIGLSLIAVGLLLLSGVGVYYAYGFYSYSQLGKLNASIEGPLSLPSERVDGFTTSPSGSAAPSRSFSDVAQAAANDSTITLTSDELPHAKAADSASSFEPPALPRPVEEYAPQEASPAAERRPFPVASYASIYPGNQMHPKYWHQPLWAGADPYIYQARQEGAPPEYRRVSAAELLAFKGKRPPAERIRIPVIGVDSPVRDLQILNLGDSRAYETPDKIVGHIPRTANPGERGNGWFFGHLESPLRGEGNVFNRLPELAKHLTDGDQPVYIILESKDGEYLYQAVSSRVMHQDDLELYDTRDATITLVTCANRPRYDHRQLVTARLIGVKPARPSP
jgi:LPXTG-site transpeptidase (sortase) family protein